MEVKYNEFQIDNKNKQAQVHNKLQLINSLMEFVSQYFLSLGFGRRPEYNSIFFSQYVF